MENERLKKTIQMMEKRIKTLEEVSDKNRQLQLKIVDLEGSINVLQNQYSNVNSANSTL